MIFRNFMKADMILLSLSLSLSLSVSVSVSLSLSLSPSPSLSLSISLSFVCVCVREIPQILFSSCFVHNSLRQFSFAKVSCYKKQIWRFPVKVKEMLFKGILGDLEWKIFLIDQPWWATFRVSFADIFVRKTHRLKILLTCSNLLHIGSHVLQQSFNILHKLYSLRIN